jgi:hypothetical protein
MAEKERIGRTLAKSLSVGGVAFPKVAAGSLSVTGTGSVTAPAGFTAITAVLATLGTDAALTGLTVSYVSTGLTVTLKVWKPTASGDATPIAATAAKTVSYAIFGS